MPEIAGLVVVLLVCSLAGAWIALGAAERRRNAELARLPANAIGPGSVAAGRARETYRIAQQSVRALEALLNDDMVRVTIPEARQTEIRLLIDRFYDL